MLTNVKVQPQHMIVIGHTKISIVSSIRFSIQMKQAAWRNDEICCARKFEGFASCRKSVSDTGEFLPQERTLDNGQRVVGMAAALLLDGKMSALGVFDDEKWSVQANWSQTYTINKSINQSINRSIHWMCIRRRQFKISTTMIRLEAMGQPWSTK